MNIETPLYPLATLGEEAVAFVGPLLDFHADLGEGKASGDGVGP